MEVAIDVQPEESIVQDNPSKMSSVPSTPLQQISPERLNQRLAQSPSIPLNFEQSARRSQHRGSDASEVKAKVAFLNSMSGSPVRGGSPTKPYHHASSHAAIQRAIVGREEAEAALNAMTAQLDSARARERLVSERVESLMEQLQEARNRQRHERQVYEKEVKVSKKNEYKAELAVIKLQEEMKEVKNELDGFRTRADHDKNEKDKARQEAFERAYAVAGMTEEIKTLKDRLQVVEQERDSAVATAAMKLEIPVEKKAPVEYGPEHVPSWEQPNSLKRKKPMPDLSDLFPEIILSDEEDLDEENWPVEKKYTALQRECDSLSRKLQESRDEIYLMTMECQFETCPCRKAERDGYRFVHDYEWDRKVQEKNAKRQKVDNVRPLREFVSFKDFQAEVRNRRHLAQSTTKAQSDSEVPPPATEKGSFKIPPAEEVALREQIAEPAAPLPPATAQTDETQSSEQSLEAEEAAQIPLPPAGDDTAQLEEFTQVVVNPPAVTQTLSVTTATPFDKPCADLEVHSARSHDVGYMSEELFNLSPPRRAPPRPSTAMGIVSGGSPIRMVQNSPQPRSACGDPPQILKAQSQTTRVALNDASSRHTSRAHHISQSKSAVRSHSRGRPPAFKQDSRPNSALGLRSPASSTVFPLTPAKNPRNGTHKAPPNKNQVSTGRDVHQHQPSSTHGMNETTTTTSVPLRGEDDSFDLGTSQNSMSSEPSRNSAFLKDAHNVAGTPISREAALAQIRARRDRARSVNMRKAEKEGGSGENERKGAKTPVSAARRGVKIDLGQRAGRDFSQASAPGRF